MTGFNVDAQALRRHAATVDGVGKDIAECRSASDQEGLGGLVYGVIFDPTALPLLELGKHNHAAMISAAASTAHAIADGLRSNAASYEFVERDIKKQLHKLVPDVEGTGDGRR